MPHPYSAFELPVGMDAVADWQLFLNSAVRFRAALERIPDGPNRKEALRRLDQAVMVASGAFHVRPGKRGQ